MPQVIAGIMNRAAESTLFFNPTANSYRRLGTDKAPGYVSWSRENRCQLLRIPVATGDASPTAELRSPDPTANPYIAYALMIRAALEGIASGALPEEGENVNLSTVNKDTTDRLDRLPSSLAQAADKAAKSGFIAANLPNSLVRAYLARG